MEAFSGAVLTGGQGRRLGAEGPKPLLPLAGRPLAAYALDVLRQAGAAEVFAAGGNEPTRAALQGLGFTPLDDGGQANGPLDGIVAALAAAARDRVAVVACDMPLVTAHTIRRLVAAAATHPGATAVGTTEDRRQPPRRQPLLAVYPKAAAPVLHDALARGVRAMHEALERLDVIDVPLADPAEALNVNTPADLAVAEDVLRRRSTSPAGGGR